MRTQRNFNRRDVIKTAGVVAAGALAGAFPRGWARADDAKAAKKVLFFTRSQGFQHDIVERKPGEELGFGEKLLIDWGKDHGFDVTATKDGSVFTPDKLGGFDLIVFYTTGNLEAPGGADHSVQMPEGGKKALLDFVANGKGFVAMHCGSDTFHGGNGKDADPYIKMLGGEFVTHGGQQKSKIKVVDPDFIPGLKDFEIEEEWYRLKNFAPDLHVICVQETESMSEAQYKNEKPYPETWARMHEKGRVFFTSMGHRRDVWQNKIFQDVLLGGMSWAAGNVQHDIKPNLADVTPDAMTRLGQ